MNRQQEMVRDFHHVMEQPAPREVTPMDLATTQLRCRLIFEEAKEFFEASGMHIATPTDQEAFLELSSPMEPVIADQVDALVDLLYVVYGAANAMGVDLEPFFDLVHIANMQKANGPVREDGKRMKPEGWKPPPIAKMLEALKFKRASPLRCVSSCDPGYKFISIDEVNWIRVPV